MVVSDDPVQLETLCGLNAAACRRLGYYRGSPAALSVSRDIIIYMLAADGVFRPVTSVPLENLSA